MTPRTRARLRRERMRPDNRPRWDDPNLLCGHIDLSAQDMSLYAEFRLTRMSDKYSWRNDPTYDMKKKKKNPA